MCAPLVMVSVVGRSAVNKYSLVEVSRFFSLPCLQMSALSRAADVLVEWCALALLSGGGVRRRCLRVDAWLGALGLDNCRRGWSFWRLPYVLLERAVVSRKVSGSEELLINTRLLRYPVSSVFLSCRQMCALARAADVRAFLDVLVVLSASFWLVLSSRYRGVCRLFPLRDPQRALMVGFVLARPTRACARWRRPRVEAEPPPCASLCAGTPPVRDRPARDACALISLLSGDIPCRAGAKRRSVCTLTKFNIFKKYC